MPAQPSVLPPAHEPVPNKWIITLAVTVGTLMGAIDSSIVNVALPYIQSNLGVTIDQITWVSTGYLISLVIVMPLTAWLGGMFGRKRVYMSCLALFLISSFFCGQAHSLEELVVFRVLQGVGAGALQPTEQAILRETFPLEEQGMAMALYGVAVMIGPAIGPTLGGWITDNYTWRWIFYINLPIGIAGLMMVWQFVHDPPFLKNQPKPTIDYIGIGLLAVGLATLQTMLEQGERYDWFTSNFIVGATVLAAICLIAFVIWELRTDEPAVDLRLLKNIPFTSGTLIGGVLGVSLFGTMFLLPLFMQDLLGYTPMQSGLALMPRAVTMIVLMPITGYLYNRLGAKALIGSGLLISAYAGWMMSRFTLDIGYINLLIPQVIQGVGFSMIFVALSTVSLAAVPRTKLTNAAGIYNLVRQLGGSFGVAIMASLLVKHMTTAHAVLVANATPYNSSFHQWMMALQQRFMSMGADEHLAQTKALAVIEGMIQGQASVMAYEWVFGLSALMMLFSLPMVITLKNVRKSNSSGKPPVAVE
ncbi:MAG TPA: DHA2 family efflux MFS transporter permease subunit [Armatimonadota bacterium]|nr:DHA2 family efflux MFS transporter permease subunit [Armatimonadota bacterium]